MQDMAVFSFLLGLFCLFLPSYILCLTLMNTHFLETQYNPIYLCEEALESAVLSKYREARFRMFLAP